MKKLVSLFLVLATVIAVAGCDGDEVFNADEQLEIDIRLIDQYLADNFLTAQVDESSQLRYIINQSGTGDNASFGNSVEVHYTGYLLDGTEFDSSIGRGSFTFVLGRGDVISGWDVGFQKLNVGATATLFIPSGLAYGNSRGPAGDLAPNSVLIFDVTVIDIR
ncbi:MAG: FKBP-type peptidyl-prolyl cis-trans isomerase [Roseivirga sp.]